MTCLTVKKTRYPCAIDLHQIIVEGLPYCLALLDQNGRILEANQNFLEMIGRSKTELLAKKLCEIWPQGSRRKIATAVRRGLKGEANRCQTDWHRPDGGVTTWELLFNPLMDR